MFIKWLGKIFVPESSAAGKPEIRMACGVFCGYVGIAINVILFAVKITVGILSGSIAVAADAVNNLSDAGSAGVTILGFKMAAKPADREHPFGHGRIELCCAVVVAVIIMMMGFDFLKEAVTRIIHPGEVSMTPLLTGLVAGSLVFKLWLYFFYRHMGRLIDSSTLKASAFDSLSDMIGTAVVLAAVWCSGFTSFPVDGCAGVVVAAMVLIGGGKILRDAISPLLGEPPGEEMVRELQTRLLQCEGITGVHDIIMHNYGPNQYFATAHAEVEMKGNLLTAHDMLESAEVEIGKNMPIHLLLHCDPYNPEDQEGKIWRVRFENVVADFEPVFKVYDFRMKKESGRTILSCHILIPRNYLIPHAEIIDILSVKMAEYSPEVELKLELIHPYV